jgi:hypothetical protein
MASQVPFWINPFYVSGIILVVLIFLLVLYVFNIHYFRKANKTTVTTTSTDGDTTVTKPEKSLWLSWTWLSITIVVILSLLILVSAGFMIMHYDYSDPAKAIKNFTVEKWKKVREKIDAYKAEKQKQREHRENLANTVAAHNQNKTDQEALRKEIQEKARERVRGWIQERVGSRQRAAAVLGAAATAATIPAMVDAPDIELTSAQRLELMRENRRRLMDTRREALAARREKAEQQDVDLENVMAEEEPQIEEDEEIDENINYVERSRARLSAQRQRQRRIREERILGQMGDLFDMENEDLIVAAQEAQNRDDEAEDAVEEAIEDGVDFEELQKGLKEEVERAREEAQRAEKEALAVADALARRREDPVLAADADPDLNRRQQEVDRVKDQIRRSIKTQKDSIDSQKKTLDQLLGNLEAARIELSTTNAGTQKWKRALNAVQRAQKRVNSQRVNIEKSELYLKNMINVGTLAIKTSLMQNGFPVPTKR